MQASAARPGLEGGVRRGVAVAVRLEGGIAEAIALFEEVKNREETTPKSALSDTKM